MGASFFFSKRAQAEPEATVWAFPLHAASSKSTAARFPRKAPQKAAPRSSRNSQSRKIKVRKAIRRRLVQQSIHNEKEACFPGFSEKQTSNAFEVRERRFFRYETGRLPSCPANDEGALSHRQRWDDACRHVLPGHSIGCLYRRASSRQLWNHGPTSRPCRHYRLEHHFR